MALNPKVIQAKLHNAPKVVTNEQRANMQNASVSEASAAKLRESFEKRQEEIDSYNSECNNLDSFFDTFQLGGKDVIIKLHKENYIKGITEVADGTPMYDAWISQVDGRMRQTHDAKWVDNPLPYVFTGVVQAISPLVTAEYINQKKTLASTDANLAAKFKVLEVGDIVHLNHFMFADTRFYKDKQERDFLKNPEEFKIEYWEGLVKVHAGLIEGIVLDKETFLEQLSPYQQYLKFVKERKESRGY